jgi:RNA recognition motif-containing protein
VCAPSPACPPRPPPITRLIYYPGLHRKPCVHDHGGRAEGVLRPRLGGHVRRSLTRSPGSDPDGTARSTSCQIIQRGTRSAGYAFIAFSNEAAAVKAAESLNKKELDGREVQVELAKSPQEKEKKPRTKKPKSRRGDGKAPPGEVTEAEANGETAAGAADGAAPLTDEAAKPKKKKKSAVRTFASCSWLSAVR